MQFRLYLLVIFVIICGLGFFFYQMANGRTTKTTYDGPLKVISWIPYWDQERAVQSFRQNVNSFDSISVFWYHLTPSGKIETYNNVNEDTSLLAFAKENNVKILALVANLADYDEGGGWDYNRVDQVISSRQARKKHIGDLVRLIEKHDFDGIDIDYEALKRYQRKDFTNFIKELADELHKRDKILGVAIHPKTSEYDPAEDNGSHAQDLKKIAKAADQLYFMTYLEHGTFSGPGSAGSVGWMEEVMQFALDEKNIAKEKTFLGIGLTGHEWKKNEQGEYKGINNDVTFDRVLQIVQDNGLEPSWDDASKTPYIRFDNESGSYEFWFENSLSIQARLDLAKKLGVGGVAFWRLGGEDPQMWNILEQYR